ncbi:Conserved_hypothetical protein [Hexamita inflata]|uniref:Uncharacterized protein n=1 Tax=Hexamita inflata TaxID=28002 RepID=A0AA86P3D7_9EUKA|nr:Conserved hypothetical protein [Hexamita inflata]CAI9969692.1 Conserved hypothetical protein [Hexamita inflata]
MQFQVVKLQTGELEVQAFTVLDQVQQSQVQLPFQPVLIYDVSVQTDGQQIQPVSITECNQQVILRENTPTILLMVSDHCEMLLFNVNQQRVTAHITMKAKHFKIAVTHELLAVYTPQPNIVTEQLEDSLANKPEPLVNSIDLFQLNERFTHVMQVQIPFVPSHIQVSATKLAVYECLSKSQFKLHVLEFRGMNVVSYSAHELDKRCKTLQIDGDDVCLVLKDRKDKYWFQRFSTQHMLPIPSSASFDLKSQRTDLSQSETSDNTLQEPIPEIDAQIYQVVNNSIKITNPLLLAKIPVFNSSAFQPAQQLEYQFRTTQAFKNFIISGRFDTYLLMQRRKNPANCVLHSYIQLQKFTEKLCVDGDGYIVCSVDPEQGNINVYKNYQFDSQISIKNNGIILKNKVQDLCVDQNKALFAISEGKKLIQFGNISQQKQRISCEKEWKYCINKGQDQILIQTESKLMFGSATENQIQWYQEASYDLKQTQNIEGDDMEKVEKEETQKKINDEEFSILDRSAKILKFEKDEENIKLFWKCENGEVKVSKVKMTKF